MLRFFWSARVTSIVKSYHKLEIRHNSVQEVPPIGLVMCENIAIIDSKWSWYDILYVTYAPYIGIMLHFDPYGTNIRSCTNC